MSKIGCKHMCFKPEGGETGFELAGLVEANLTINTASGELYADDIRWEHEEQFASGSLATEIADLTLQKQADLFGHTYTSGTNKLEKKAGDSAPYGVLGYVRTISRRGVANKIYQAVVFNKAKASEGADNAQTKGSSIEYQTNAVTFGIDADDNGLWNSTTEHDTEAAAIAAVNTACGIS